MQADTLQGKISLWTEVSIPNHYDMFASNSEDPRKFTDFIPQSRVLEFNTEYEISDILAEV